MATSNGGKSDWLDLRGPAPWSVLSAASLLLALCLTTSAPDSLFWGAALLSCACAAIATWLRGAGKGVGKGVG